MGKKKTKLRNFEKNNCGRIGVFITSKRCKQKKDPTTSPCMQYLLGTIAFGAVAVAVFFQGWFLRAVLHPEEQPGVASNKFILVAAAITASSGLTYGVTRWMYAEEEDDFDAEADAASRLQRKERRKTYRIKKEKSSSMGFVVVAAVVVLLVVVGAVVFMMWPTEATEERDIEQGRDIEEGLE